MYQPPRPLFVGVSSPGVGRLVRVHRFAGAMPSGLPRAKYGHMRTAGKHAGRAVVALALTAALVGLGAEAAAAPDEAQPVPGGWIWPVSGAFRIAEPFAAPAHAYGPGHRGIDLEPAGPAVLVAPQAGVVAYAGTIAGRGIVTIDHGDGWVTTLEPIASDAVAGLAVARGDAVGTIALGGHSPSGTVHFGVRLHGEYVNPLMLLGGVPRAVLVPCCGPL